MVMLITTDFLSFVTLNVHFQPPQQLVEGIALGIHVFAKTVHKLSGLSAHGFLHRVELFLVLHELLQSCEKGSRGTLYSWSRNFHYKVSIID